MLIPFQSCQHRLAPPGIPPRDSCTPKTSTWSIGCLPLLNRGQTAGGCTNLPTGQVPVMLATCRAVAINRSTTNGSDHNLHLTKCRYMHSRTLTICKLAAHGMTSCVQLLHGAATGTVIPNVEQQRTCHAHLCLSMIMWPKWAL